MSRVSGLVRACHPEPTLAVTLIVTALAQAAGARTGWVFAAFLSGQLTTGWTNDYLDRARDAATRRPDKPLVRGDLTPRALALAAGLAGCACVPLSLAMGWRAGLAHLLAVASAFGYNAGLKATAASFVPYAVSFGLVPSVIALGTPAHRWAPWWATAAGVLLGVGAHLANTLPDLADDAATGVRGLPHRLGARVGAALAALLLLAATGLLVFGPGRPGRLGLLALAVAAAVTATGLVLARRDGSRAAFQAALVVAALGVATLLARGTALT